MIRRSLWAPSALAFFLLFVGCDPAGPDVDAGPETDGQADGCPGGTRLCGDECVDTANDRRNCGGCDMRCASGEACVEGACGVVCPDGQSACSGACFDTDTSRLHCGACGNACAAGEACVDGACELSCPAGHTVCGSVCADTSSDPNHCGGCDLACATGEVCSEGECAASCGTGLVDCGGACVDLDNNPAHCGTCENACATPASSAAVCVAGTCGAVCLPLAGDCDGDLANGCEGVLDTDPANCGACNRECALPNTDVSGCAAGACTVTACASGFDDCDGAADNGCEAELASDGANCGACGNACGSTETCVSGACVPRVGEDCTDAFVLSPGTNTIAWTSTMADYLTTVPACVSSSYSLLGPDVVMSYTATEDERVTLDFSKPTSTRWGAVVSTAACGTLSPAIACLSEFTTDSMLGSFVLGAGETAYVYLRDTSSGTNPLDNPLVVDLTSAPCTDPAPVVSLEPADGALAGTRSPTFVVTFGAPIISSSGTITLTGDLGTSIAYDLSTSPAEVAFSAGNTVVTIEPGVTFPPNEHITVSWSGLRSVPCTTPVAVPPPTWTVTIPTPPCVPGVGGVVGTTMTRFAGPPSSLEYYVYADEDPAGWVYVGGTSELYRMPKAGGTYQDVESLAGLTTSHLGYTMLVDGLDIYTVDSDTTGTTGHVFRISSDGGATWSIQDYVRFPRTPGDDIRGITAYGGRLYMVTEESASGDTEVWSVDAAATVLPADATLEFTFTGEGWCHGIVRDTTNFYLACGDNDTLIRIPVGGGAVTVITNEFDLTVTANALDGEDLDGDGVFDVLYAHGYYEENWYVCDPASATPYADVHSSFGTSTSNYGMGFDRTGNVLWMFDDDTDEFVSFR